MRIRGFGRPAFVNIFRIIGSGLVDPQQRFTRGAFGENRVMSFKFDVEEFKFVAFLCGIRRNRRPIDQATSRDPSPASN